MPRVILLPGACSRRIRLSRPRHRARPEVDAVAKDLELYATPEPPEVYDLELEVAGVLREADDRGWERFHLVGYSGGGAASLAVAAARPERLASLALLEPAWAGNWDLSRQEQTLAGEFGRLGDMPADEFMPAFTRLQLAPGVPLPEPPPGDPPPWMASRPAGIRAFLSSFARATSTATPCAASIAPSTSRSAGWSNPDYFAARWRGGWTTCSRTSSLRCSRSATLRPAPPLRARAPGRRAQEALAARRSTAAPTTDPAPRLGPRVRRRARSGR